jgi:hypothetical protein
MGIGLAVSRTIIESHGGQLRALPNARFHHCLAIETRIEGGEFVPFIGIAVRFARYENLDVWGFDFHDQSGGNVDDFGNDVDDLLPFLNEFKGYLDDCG